MNSSGKVNGNGNDNSIRVCLLCSRTSLLHTSFAQGTSQPMQCWLRDVVGKLGLLSSSPPSELKTHVLTLYMRSSKRGAVASTVFTCCCPIWRPCSAAMRTRTPFLRLCLTGPSLQSMFGIHLYFIMAILQLSPLSRRFQRYFCPKKLILASVSFTAMCQAAPMVYQPCRYSKLSADSRTMDTCLFRSICLGHTSNRIMFNFYMGSLSV